MQSQFILIFLTDFNFFKEVILPLNSFNGWYVVVWSIKGAASRWLDSAFKVRTVAAILAGCDIFWIYCTVITRTNILSLHVFNRVGTFVTKATSSLESGRFNSSLSHKIFATHNYTENFSPNYQVSALISPTIFSLRFINVKWYTSSYWAHLFTIEILPVYYTTSCATLQSHIKWKCVPQR